MRVLCSAAVLVFLLLAAPAAHATSLLCCTMSSDFGELEDPTDPAQLQALFDYVVTDPILGDDLFTLTLSVENQTPVSGFDAAFNINAIFLNGTSDVLSLTLVSVTDEGAGLVTGSWGNASGSSSGAGHVLEKAENIGGFDDFGFSLWEGTGLNNPNVIQPGETSTFVFTVAAATGQPIDMDSFNIGFKGNDTSPMGAKFVSCVGSDCVSPDDSSFGSGVVVPEPGTGLLLGTGLLALGAWRRRS